MLSGNDGINELTEKIIGCAIEVHSKLGPGLLESVYHQCLTIELQDAGARIEEKRRIDIDYKGRRLRAALEIDLMVDERVVVELKAIDRINPIHLAQVITYLKLTGCPAGLILNFNSTSLRSGLRRVSHPDVYAASRK
jgi:GxxExxY protein